ncbi:precorrin-6y C5,15-methyltransferase (decarboxylating) subunit CbiE [Phaeovibrio sulfidiphilus]|uniref:Precorrin-6y C5,15-methyltransferase (Decarboxylating) subunit CbiE n=1 Tax=Phaeovibrio sulfidiphilus TaxID=1220600 RepID=A0A8J6YME5_9PROT|nr:precorrin-6y C5,15-methyltransferase (decarboxylating) subunit CbiE [Phaeovibrio sulfidiphilus]MBE1236534.1 precorrin-6y C5,15-methyltransferase (decarboxylating) subunit CbiE [Phaeovibrio sulfidiphilus]
MNTPWLTIIGIGEDGLDGLGHEARAAVDSATVLMGGRRHLAMVPERPGVERLFWAMPFSDSYAALDARRGTPVCLLTSADPMLFGAGATLSRRYSAGEMRVLPQASSFSLAAGRMGWALQDTACLTVHGRPVENILPWFTEGARLLVLSENAGSPATIARLLCHCGFAESRLTVLEHMGGERENRLEGRAGTWNAAPGADLNVLAIAVSSGAPDGVVGAGLSRMPGLPDDAFQHDGQLTKQDVRAMVLGRLAPRPGELLWDVGAGSGSVGIEWMRCHPACRAIAVEARDERRANIDANRRALGVPALEIAAGSAPAALKNLPPPDAVFIGGGLTGPGVFETCWDALKPGGRLVATAVTLQTEARVLALKDSHGGSLVRIALARDDRLGGFDVWRAPCPLTLYAVQKPLA